MPSHRIWETFEDVTPYGHVEEDVAMEEEEIREAVTPYMRNRCVCESTNRT